MKWGRGDSPGEEEKKQKKEDKKPTGKTKARRAAGGKCSEAEGRRSRAAGQGAQGATEVRAFDDYGWTPQEGESPRRRN